MVTVTKTAPGRVYYRLLGTQLVKGESADVSEGVAEYLCETGEFERGGDGEDTDETGEDDFTDLERVGGATAETLHDAEYHTFDDLREASEADLAAEVSDALAASIKEQVEE